MQIKSEANIFVIEKWSVKQDTVEAKKLATLRPSFTNLPFAINQVESLLYNDLDRLLASNELSKIAHKEALIKVPLTWRDISEADDGECVIYLNRSNGYAYLILEIPVITEGLPITNYH